MTAEVAPVPEPENQRTVFMEEIGLLLRKGQAVQIRLDELLAGINAVSERHRKLLYKNNHCGCFRFYCEHCGYEHKCIHRPEVELIIMLKEIWKDTM